MTSESSDTSQRGGGNATAAGMHFQSGIGALFAARLLAETPLDDLLGLSDSRIKSVRFETNAPVDDLLVETDCDGFVAIQAKSSITLSQSLNSGLGSVADQFVRHWLAAKERLSTEGWCRPLDPSRDRLLLVFGPRSAATIRRLAAVLAPTMPATADARLREQFEDLLGNAFATHGQIPAAGELSSLLGVVRFLELDPDGADRRVALEQLTPVMNSRDAANTAFGTLINVCMEQMRLRGGFDGPKLRVELARYGIAPGASPTYARSVATLREYSQTVIDQLSSYEILPPISGDPIALTREAMPVILEAARTSSLLLTGEPGAGKSGVLNALAKALAGDRAQVVTLAVDRLPVATLGELSDQLRLEHPLLDVLAKWPGNGPAYLIIDALDATRGGPAEAVFKALIAGVMGFPGGRWRVIASIRSFDLRLGRQLRECFKGAPPSDQLADPAFSMVRHVSIPGWTDGELATILACSPELGQAIASGGTSLAALARVPFNTRLLADLLSRGTIPASFAGIKSQTDLLSYFWQERIESHGSGGELCLRRAIEYMVANNALRAPATEVAAVVPNALDHMEHEGVLIRLNGGRDVAFRHHLLFDFAVSRLLFDPADADDLRRRLVGDAALALAPALGFVLNEAWGSTPSRDSFWRIALVLADDAGSDPIARSVVARHSAELPAVSEDTSALVTALQSQTDRGAALRVLQSILGALSVRNGDRIPIAVAPWLTVASVIPELVATGWRQPISSLRVLLFILLGQAMLNAEERTTAGRVSRQFLDIALNEPNNMPAAIGYVGKTYDTAVGESRVALSSLLRPDRLRTNASKEAPWLAREIRSISRVDPAFAVEIYARLFEHEVTSDTQTRLGDSQILSLTSTEQQDYSLARYSLAEAFPEFLTIHPQQAVVAMIKAIEVKALEKSKVDSGGVKQAAIGGRTVTLIADRSFYWAWNIDNRHPSDAEKLLQAVTRFLMEAPPEQARCAAETLRDQARFGVVWSRLLLAAAKRPELLGDLAWPIASAPLFLVAPETSKDAIDAALAILPARDPGEQAAFEQALLNGDYSNFRDPAAARTSFLRKTLTAIGVNRLRSDGALAWLTTQGDETAPLANDRPFSITSGWSEVGSRLEEAGIEGSNPIALALFNKVEDIENRFNLDQDKPTITDAAALLSEIESLRTTIDDSRAITPQAKADASRPVIKGVHALVSNSGRQLEDVCDATNRLSALVEWLAQSESPEADDETEARFEDSAGWGSPAPRVDAAEIAFDLINIEPTLAPRLLPVIDLLLTDRHPAVRLMAAQHLTALWFVDQEAMWQRVEGVAKSEQNLGVLRFFVPAVLNRLISEPDRLEPIVLQLSVRLDTILSGRSNEITIEHLSALVAALMVWRNRAQSRALIEQRLEADVVESHGFLEAASTAAGAALILGYEDDGDASIRARGQRLIAVIIERAADTLAEQLAFPTDARNQAQIDASVQLLDNTVRQLRSAGMGLQREERPGLDTVSGKARFLTDLAPQLRRIGDVAPPRTLHELFELLDHLLTGDPTLGFGLVAHGLLNAGQLHGYQAESLGADLVVRIVGRVLADYRTIFADDTLRRQLVEVLELFIDQGWPAAHRLLYELPELFR